MKFPPHKASLYLQHNDHLSSYQTVETWLADERNIAEEPSWESPAHRQRAIDTNEIWVLQWYPDTPIGFHRVAAPTLEELLAFANQASED